MITFPGKSFLTESTYILPTSQYNPSLKHSYIPLCLCHSMLANSCWLLVFVRQNLSLYLMFLFYFYSIKTLVREARGSKVPKTTFRRPEAGQGSFGRPKAAPRYMSGPLDHHRSLGGLWPPKSSFFLTEKEKQFVDFRHLVWNP